MDEVFRARVREVFSADAPPSSLGEDGAEAPLIGSLPAPDGTSHLVNGMVHPFTVS